MGGSAWIKAESSPGTSGAMCWNLFPGPEWPSGGAIVPQNVADLELPEPPMASNALFMAFWGCFEPFSEPPDGNVRREKRFQRISMCVPYLDPTMIHLVWPIWSYQNRLWPHMHFGAVLSPSEAPHNPKNGPSREKMWALCSTIIT